MLNTYLRIAFRSFIKNRLFTAINLVGLSFTMAFGLIFILMIKSQFEYDKSHDNAKRIYRIITSKNRTGNIEFYATSPPIILDRIKQYPFVEDAVYLKINKTYISESGAKEIPLNIQFTDPSFLSIFHFNFVHGAASALDEPNSLIITETRAQTIWGKVNPVGKILSIPGSGEFKVTAVIRSYKPSHFNFDALVNRKSYFDEKLPISEADKWQNLEDGYTYVLVRSVYDIQKLEAALTYISSKSKQFQKQNQSGQEVNYKFIAQNLKEINPSKYPAIINEMNRGYDWNTILAISTLVFILLLMASFNYTSLSLAKSIGRAKEIGIRKINGAKRHQIIVQFVMETALLTFCATILSLGIFMLMENVRFLQDLVNTIRIDIVGALCIFVFAILTTLLSGALPAWLLSSFEPMTALRKLSSHRILSGIGFRKAIIVLQFSVTTIFITFLVIAKRQISFEKNFNYGFDTKDLVCITTEGNNIVTFVKEINKIASIKNVTAASGLPMRQMFTGTSTISVVGKPDSSRIYYYSVDENFLATLGINLVAGTNFLDGESSSQIERSVILNVTAVKALHFKSAQDAVGRFVKLDSNYVQIAGVYRDFVNWNLKYGSMPFALRNIPSKNTEVLVKVDSRSPLNSVATLGSIWHRVYPSKPFNYEFYENFMKWRIDHHKKDYFLLDLLTGLILLIASLGLIGVVSYSVDTRTKEMAIRRTLGATSGNLIWIASKSFVKILILSCIVGMPVGSYLGYKMLKGYAHRTDLTIDIFITSFLSVLLIGMVIVLTQTYRTSNVNPVKVLGSE